MKYVILLCDGMADNAANPQFLGGKTPMEAARKPHMDALAHKSLVGLAKTVPDGMKPGSDVANLSVLGYDPSLCYTGRSPLEAGSLRIDMSEENVSFRCNLVTLSEEPDFQNKRMDDYCAGDIESHEAAILIKDLHQHLAGGNTGLTFYPGVHYRHCLLWDKGHTDLGELVPPHDIPNQVIKDYLPGRDNPKGLWLAELMCKANRFLENHPVNQERKAKGLHPANGIWLWGEGRKAALEPFSERFGLKGTIISAVDLLKGIGFFAQMEVLEVAGATGYIDTNYQGKLQAALDALSRGQDFIYIHIEAPDECGHRGEANNKVMAIEDIDSKVLGPLLEGLQQYDDFKLLIMPDHPTPLDIKTHTADPVPFLLYHKSKPAEGPDVFSEKSAAATGFNLGPAHNLIPKLLL